MHPVVTMTERHPERDGEKEAHSGPPERKRPKPALSMTESRLLANTSPPEKQRKPAATTTGGTSNATGEKEAHSGPLERKRPKAGHFVDDRAAASGEHVAAGGNGHQS